MSGQITYKPNDYPPGIVAIPALDFLLVDSVAALMQLAGSLPAGSTLDFARGPTSIAAKRNLLSETFLERQDLDWILFLDADMQPHPATVARLLSHDKDIVGASYYGRIPPFEKVWAPLPGVQIHEDCDLPCEVAFIGTGCLLIKRAVLSAIPFPWFEHGPPGLGEDVIFCDKARQKGFHVYVDCGLTCGHMTPQPVTKESALAFQRTPAGQAMLRNPSVSPRVRAMQESARANVRRDELK